MRKLFHHLISPPLNYQSLSHHPLNLTIPISLDPKQPIQLVSSWRNSGTSPTSVLVFFSLHKNCISQLANWFWSWESLEQSSEMFLALLLTSQKQQAQKSWLRTSRDFIRDSDFFSSAFRQNFLLQKTSCSVPDDLWVQITREIQRKMCSVHLSAVEVEIKITNDCGGRRRSGKHFFSDNDSGGDKRATNSRMSGDSGCED